MATATDVGIHSLANTELVEQYARWGFGGQAGWGERPALLVIDMATAWTDTNERIGSDLSGAMGSILELLSIAREKGLPIFFTVIAFDEALKGIGTVIRKKAPYEDDLVIGSKRVELEPALERRPDEPLIVKPRGSAFYGTHLLSMLAERVDTVIVTDCSTSGCIRATATDAHDNSFHVIVPLEAVGDRCRSAHEANLLGIDARYGDVMPLSQVVARSESMPARAA